MKRLLIISALAVILSLSISKEASAKRPSFIPEGARWRIDLYKEPTGVKEERGHWDETAFYGDWGQGQCIKGGDECGLNDVLTWWKPSAKDVSEPSEDCDSSIF